jgi:hypothetical protein
MQSAPSPFGSSNPYATPMQVASAYVETPLPTMCKVMFIMSLVFSSLRLLVVLLSVVLYRNAGTEENPLRVTVGFEIITGAMVALVGIAANIFLLMKKWVGIPLGSVLIAGVIGSICVGIWQGIILIGNYQAGTPEFVGAIFGAALTTIFRGTLLALYATALIMYSKWYQRQPR